MSKFDTSIQCEETFTTSVLYISECCGEYLDSEQAQYEVCPCCKEHCEVIYEEINEEK